MPVKHIQRSIPANQYYRNTSFENLAASWFTRDGWEVFKPDIDHDMKTDLLVSDGSNYYRIQIKTVDTTDETILVNNMWGNKKIDYVIYFSTKSNWGYIAKAFYQRKKRVNHPEHIRFHQHHKPFIKAFSRI
ncbi:MAG: hypothetical protein NWQ54_09735 [Paraglaciecola sp.]|nr:hypothetical protein [Paraglaciecola sp.]